MTAGFVTVPRGSEDLFGNVTDEPFCRRGAYFWLFDKAVWRETDQWAGKIAVHLQRGQLCCSLRYLARAWGWTHGRVQRWLELLVKRGKILTDNIAGRVVVTLVGYDQQPKRESNPRPQGEPATESRKARPAQAESGGRESPASHSASQRRIQEQEALEKDSKGAGRDAPSAAEIAHVDAIVAENTAALTGNRIRDPQAYKAAVKETRFGQWLRGKAGFNDGGLYRFVCDNFTVGPELFQAQADISTAVEAGSAAATPVDVMKRLNALDDICQQHRGVKTKAWEKAKIWRRAERKAYSSRRDG